MVNETMKNKLFVMEFIVVTAAVIFFGTIMLNKYFPSASVALDGSDGAVPGIVGFVPVEINNQPINLVAKEPSAFLLFTEKKQEFLLTSLMLSGRVVGDGRAEILLDNGIGQELMIYSNIKTKQGNAITGLAVGDDGGGPPFPEDIPIKDLAPDVAWLKILKTDQVPATVPVEQLENKRAVPGEFETSCVDTCYINMKMRDQLFYTLKVRVDPGTEVYITSMKYTIDV